MLCCFVIVSFMLCCFINYEFTINFNIFSINNFLDLWFLYDV
jgi:hypothetical protein